MDWLDIEAKLGERAEEVCRHLLPNGHREGANYVCGDISGKEGVSLKVNLEGKVGVWKDFAGDKGGKTLISLWCSIVGGASPFKTAIVAAKEFLGIRDDFDQRVRSYPQPRDPAAEQADESNYKAVADTWAKCQPLTEGGPVWNYLTETRGLRAAALASFDVREYLSRGKWSMVFPYYPPAEGDQGEVVRRAVSAAMNKGEVAPAAPQWLKFERLDRPDGKKKEWTSRAPEKSLFGIQIAEQFPDCRHVLICEGEKDALTWLTYGCTEWGILPVSVPFGAKWKAPGQASGANGLQASRPSPNREWLDRCWKWLQGFETVFIAMDADESGKKAAADIIAEIGPRRCRLVELPKDGHEKPYKDANDCLLAGVQREEMKYAIDQAIDFAPTKVVSAGDFEKQFMEEWFEKHLETGLQVPWGFPQFKIRHGEMTLWAGLEGSGKTTLLNFLINALMFQGERALVASFEIKPAKTLKKLSRQAFGDLIYDRDFLERCKTAEEKENYEFSARSDAMDTFRWLAKSLWIYNHTGIGNWRELGDDIRYARRRYGIRQFVIDNFMRLGIVKDDYAQQADAITYFTALAMELDVHIHVVIHQNKSEGKKGSAGGKRTVSGAFEILANAHNIVEVQRDEVKGEQVSELFEELKIEKISKTEFNERKAQLDLKPDGKFTLHKQRDGEHQNGSKYLWFLWRCQQYVDVPPSNREYRPLRFVRMAKQEAEKAAKKDLPFDPPEELK
jgi:twinkle protein